MKGLWAIAVDELRSKRALLMGMLALGALPWAAPFLPGLHRFDAADVRSAFMILVGLSLPPALGLGLGASAVGEEIGGRRLGFYFARPIGAWAIWGGKMLVALLVPLLAALVVFIPGAIVLLAGKRELAEALAAAAVLSALLCGLAHVGAGLYRTRSPWLALDLVAGAFVVGGFFLVGRHMVDNGGAEEATRVGPWLAGVLLVCCLGAGLAQVAFGRTDPQQGHMALAGVLWGGLLLCLGMSSAAAAWYLSPPPADLRDRVVLPLGGGERFLLSAFGSRGRGLHAPLFALDSQTGAARQVAAQLSPAAVSPNGRHAVFIEGLLSPRLVLVSDVAGQPPVITRASLDNDGSLWPLCLSDDGALIVLKYASFAQVVDTATAKARSGPRLDADACSFEGTARVVLYRRDAAAGSVDRSSFDLASGRSGETVRFAGAERPMALRADRLLARTRGSGLGPVALFDAGTGQVLRSFGRLPISRSPPALLLRDRRAVVLNQSDFDDNNVNVVRLFDAAGDELWATKIGERGGAALVGETKAGEVVVATWFGGELPRTLYLDGASGRVIRELEGLVPAPGSPFHAGFDPTSDLSERRIESLIFVDRTEALFRVDPATGERILLVPGHEGVTWPEFGS